MGGMEPGDDDVAQPSGRRPCHLSVGGFEISMVAGREGSQVPRSDMSIPWLGRHWLFAVNLAMALFIGGTLLPPVLMSLGLVGPAQVTYKLYGLNCHQLPERSYFVFGPDAINTYSLEKVLALGANPNYLRGFVGNAEVGFKLGMAQRNTAIYTAALLAGLAYALLRKRTPRLAWPFLFLLILPMALDGGSHVFSEVSGLAFRETNSWLVALTGGAFSEIFYTGTTAGSFNWLMRTLTGMLFAVGCVWFAFPYLEQGFGGSRRLNPKTVSHPETQPISLQQTRTEGQETR